MLTTNESKLDRVLRVVLGIAILALTFFGPKTLWGLVGFIPLITGAVGFCPIYRVLGISTHHERPSAHGGLAS